MEKHACVKSFCYLGDTLDGDGGADLAATARIRNGWMKFRELLPYLSNVPDAIECEHLPTQGGYDDELESGRDPDENDEHADELP